MSGPARKWPRWWDMRAKLSRRLSVLAGDWHCQPANLVRRGFGIRSRGGGRSNCGSSIASAGYFIAAQLRRGVLSLVQMESESQFWLAVTFKYFVQRTEN